MLGSACMSQETSRAEITRKTVFYQTPGADAVTVRADIAYRASAPALTMDIYYPPEAKSGVRVPAVIVVAGYPDPGFERFLGCKFKEMGSTVSWGRLIAASGMIAITYSNADPATDLDALREHARQDAAPLGIDERRIGLWASSGNVPLALSLIAQKQVKCAALCYGYMLDLDGSTRVAEAAKMWGFANPAASKSMDEFPADVPLLIVRAGQDQTPGLNETIDSFLTHAVRRNLPVAFVNHPPAPHAFDLMEDSERSRAIIRQVLDFLKENLSAE